MDSKIQKDINNTRPPVVTIMGHVDHGKTSILDFIRKTNIQEQEYGGITQHIGAYQIEYKDRKITFIDTPGHAAFTQMRSRGGKAADIVVLVVAADESVMPQTKEAISHAKAANAPIIVAINKIDKGGANLQKIKQELAQESVLVEDWGGDVMCVEVSAKTGKGIPELLDSILTLSELLRLEADKKGELEATIIEAKLDRKKGVVVSVILRNGSLKIGDEIIASGHAAKVKSLINDKGTQVKEALPGDPVEILGFSQVPSVGDLLLIKGSELAELAKDISKVEIIGKDARKLLSLILKADTQGTLEAVKASLSQLASQSVGDSFALKIVHSGTGDLTESDVMLAQSVDGFVLGFNVRVPANVESLADTYKVKVKTYKTIYDLIDEAKDLLEGTAFQAEQKIKGRAKVLKTFKLASGDIVAGVKVLAGALKEGSRINVYNIDPADVTQDDEPIYKGNIKKLKHGKDEIAVAGKDTECGVLFKPGFDSVKADYWIEVR